MTDLNFSEISIYGLELYIEFQLLLSSYSYSSNLMANVEEKGLEMADYWITHKMGLQTSKVDLFQDQRQGDGELAPSL